MCVIANWWSGWCSCRHVGVDWLSVKSVGVGRVLNHPNLTDQTVSQSMSVLVNWWFWEFVTSSSTSLGAIVTSAVADESRVCMELLALVRADYFPYPQWYYSDLKFLINDQEPCYFGLDWRLDCQSQYNCIPLQESWNQSSSNSSPYRCCLQYCMVTSSLVSAHLNSGNLVMTHILINVPWYIILISLIQMLE